MELSAWSIYLISLLDIVGIFFIAVSTILIGLPTVILSVDYLETHNKEKTIIKKHTKKIILGYVFFISMFIIGVLMPSTKTVCAMYALPKIVRSGTIQTVAEDSGDIYNLGVEKLKEFLTIKKEEN